jgi:hypothetical protein
MHAASHPFCTSVSVRPSGKVAAHSDIAGVYSEWQSDPARVHATYKLDHKGVSSRLQDIPRSSNFTLINHLKCKTDLNDVKSLCFIKHHNIKMYGETEVKLHAFLNSALLD